MALSRSPAHATEPEAALHALFRERGIEALFGPEVPRLWNTQTGRWNDADFFLSATSLHIEAKGQLSLDAIRKIVALARGTRLYYLYQHDDCDWRPSAGDWPKGVLTSRTLAALRARATAAANESRLAQRPRMTKARRYPRTQLAHNRALQQAELVLLARNPRAAEAASQVTLRRLTRYLETFMYQIGLVTPEETNRALSSY